MSTQDPALVRVRPLSWTNEVFGTIDDADRPNGLENQDELAPEDSSSPATPIVPSRGRWDQMRTITIQLLLLIVPSRRRLDQIKTITFRLLLLCGIGLLLLGVIGLLVLCAWWLIAFPKVSKIDIDRLVELPYLAFDTNKRLSQLAVTTPTCTGNADAAAQCSAALIRLHTNSSNFTLSWHEHTMNLTDALDQRSFSHADVTVNRVLSCLGDIEVSTSEALTACDSFFATLDAETCNVPIANYRMSEEHMKKALNALPSVRALWGLHGAAWFLDLWAMPIQVAWGVGGLRTELSAKAVVIKKLLEEHHETYGGRVWKFLEKVDSRSEDRRKTSWSRGIFNWV